MNSKNINRLAMTWIGLSMFVFVLIGVTCFGLILMKKEMKDKRKDLIDRGTYLVSLLSLSSSSNLYGNERDFFLRTLTERSSSEGLIYCFVHDQTGRPFVSLIRHAVGDKVPNNIKTISLASMGLEKQNFNAYGSRNVFYEFSKSIFANGEKSGTIRLGFQLPHITFWTTERIRFLIMIAFFIYAMIILFYYGVTLTLNPLRKISRDIKSNYGDPSIMIPNNKRSNGISFLVKEFRQSLDQVSEKLTNFERENMSLSSKLGILTFEKMQVLNILDSINLGALIIDTQDNISYVNNLSMYLLDKEKGDVIGQSIDKVLEHDVIQSFIADKEIVKRYPTHNSVEVTFPEVAPGDIYTVSFCRLKDFEDAFIGKLITFKKVTSEKLLEKARNEFLSHIAHELKTPLTSIKSYSEMLMDDEIETREMKKEFYNTINDEADRLTGLIQNLLNFSRIEMGGLTLTNSLVKTEPLLKDCIESIEATAKKKQIQIERKLPDIFPSLIGDKELFKVAIINILSNAVKYTPENGKITCSLSEEDGFVIFDIKDTGHGISEKDFAHIFDKFYRSKDSHVCEQSGSGLGLSISAEIIDLHGGDIEAESIPGEGSRFTIRMPKEEYLIEKK